MPEGPEVRRYADRSRAVLTGREIVSLTARTKSAWAWLEERPDAVSGRRIERVWSKGKNLVGRIAGGYIFYAHLMMWGRWEVIEGPPPAERDWTCRPQSDWGSRHYVFRRTNLPCVVCGDTVFCPTCQGRPVRPRRVRTPRILRKAAAG